MRGLSPGAWDEALEDREVLNNLLPIMLLDMGNNPDNPDLVIDYAKRRSLSYLIPITVHELWAFWRDREKQVGGA